MFSNIKKLKTDTILEIAIYTLPIAIIIGNFAINIVSILAAFLFLINFQSRQNLKNDNFVFKLSSLLIMLLLTNVLLSGHESISIRGSLGILKYYILFLAILYCFENKENFFKNFSLIIFLSVLFVMIDSIIQFTFGLDIFQNKIINNRLTGPFGTEKVVGSYISKFFFVGLLYLFLFYKKNSIIFFYMTTALIVTFLTQERASTIMLVSSLLIFILLSSFNKKLKLTFVFCIFITFFSIISLNSSFKNRFYNEIKIIIFTDSHHKAHLNLASQIIKNNLLFGSGIKSFREECKKKIYIDRKSKISGCANHPHNIYFEIFSDTGIIGFIFFIFFILILLKKLILKLKNSSQKKYSLIFILYFYVIFSPIQTTGSFFSTWNGVFYWICLSFIVFYIRKNKFIIDSGGNGKN